MCVCFSIFPPQHVDCPQYKLFQSNVVRRLLYYVLIFPPCTNMLLSSWKVRIVDFPVLLVSFSWWQTWPASNPSAEFVHPTLRVTPICLEPTSNWFCTRPWQGEQTRRGPSGTRRCAEYRCIHNVVHTHTHSHTHKWHTRHTHSRTHTHTVIRLKINLKQVKHIIIITHLRTYTSHKH